MATYDNIKKIKIGDNIFNLYDSGNSGGTITSVKTTAGTHTTINVTSGAANFNVPTKTSHLTNDSGFITTDYDEKVKVSALTSGTSYYPVLAAAANTASRQIDSTLQGFKYQSTAGTASAVGTATLTLGNSTASGTANNEQGVIRIYGTTTYRNDLKALDGYPEGNYTIYLPRYKAVTYLTCTSTTNAVGGATTAPVYVDNSGCIQAVTSIPYSLLTGTPTIPTIILNGSSSTSPSFYAPTSAGTSGQYLKSNGSSAPTWTTFPTIPTITLNGSATTSPSFYAPTGAGNANNILTSQGANKAPVWQTPLIIDEDETDEIGSWNNGDIYLNKATTSTLGVVSLDMIYPVGAIYISTVSTDPGTLFGGTWVQIEDTFLLAAGSTYAAGARGGEATHKLTAAESGVPAHGHGFTQPSVAIGTHQHIPNTGSTTTEYFVTSEETGANNTKVTYSSSGNRWVDGLTEQSHFHHRVATTAADLGTKTATGGAVQNNTAANATNAHNNMPPYLAVYVWKRTA